MYQQNTTTLRQSPSALMTQLNEIKELKKKFTKPGPGEYDTECYHNYIRRYRLKLIPRAMDKIQPKIKIYDPDWNFKKKRSQSIAPGPQSYNPKKYLPAKLATFSLMPTGRLKVKRDSGVSPVSYDPLRTLSMTAS